jgi:hypothetical protein
MYDPLETCMLMQVLDREILVTLLNKGFIFCYVILK